MKQTHMIECKKCGKLQSEDIYDFVETDDQEGEFSIECEHCESEINIEFTFKPFIEIK